MKKSSQSVETTFGKVTIFKNETDQSKSRRSSRTQTKNIEQPTEKPVEEPRNLQNDENLRRESEIEKNNEDFFGFPKPETSNKDANAQMDELNYFDEQLFKTQTPLNLENNVKTIKKETQTYSKIDENDNFNYIDENFFGELKVSSDKKVTKSKFQMSSIQKIDKRDIEKLEDLNYIDKMAFQSSIQGSETTELGSLSSFKLKKEKKEKKPSENIAIVQSKNLTEENSQHLKDPNRNNKEEEQVVSNHKILEKEVPKWDYITLDEAAIFLKNHVCYLNQNEGLLAIDKPYGLPSIGGPGVHLSVAKLVPKLKEMLKIDSELIMCNRLDEYTTGVMLFALNKETSNKIRHYFETKRIMKQYIAITKGVPKLPDGEINIPLLRRKVNGIYKTFLSPEYNEETQFILEKPSKENENRKNAITKYRIIDSNQSAALLELQPLTGFQHQIRAHLAYGLACPVLGDHKYSHIVKSAPQKLPDDMLRALSIRQSKVRYVPMHLHAYRVVLPEFVNNTNVFIKANLPFHFLKNLKRLKLKF